MSEAVRPSTVAVSEGVDGCSPVDINVRQGSVGWKTLGCTVEPFASEGV